MSDCNHNVCQHRSANLSMHQTLDELVFEKGIWNAALTNDLNRIEVLLKRGGDVNAIDGAGYTALHYAARNGHLDACKLLVKNQIQIDAVTRSGNATALHRACSAGKTEVVNYLLKLKANTRIKDSDGKTVLHRAAENQNFEICKAIISRDFSLKIEIDKKGFKPIDYAESEDLKEMLSP